MARDKIIEAYFRRLVALVKEIEIDQVKRVVDSLKLIYLTKGRLFIAGNGGSAATASHLVCDWMKNIGNKGFRAMSLVDNESILSAYANDVSYDAVFSSMIENLAQKRDILLVLSVSGNSNNLIKAINKAKKMGLKTLGFLGCGGGRAKRILDEYVLVPSNDYGLVEDCHLMLGHIVTSYFKG